MIVEFLWLLFCCLGLLYLHGFSLLKVLLQNLEVLNCRARLELHNEGTIRLFLYEDRSLLQEHFLHKGVTSWTLTFRLDHAYIGFVPANRNLIFFAIIEDL